VTAAQPAPPKPVIATAPAVTKTETIAEPPAQETATAPAPTAETPVTAAQPAPPKPVTATAPAVKKTDTGAQTAERSAESATRTTGSALKPPTQQDDTGLKPAAGPAVAPEKPKKQQVQVAATPKKATPPVYTVHLASMRSEVEARAEWGQLQARYPAILGDRVLFTREVEVGGQGTFVRVLTGLFQDRDQAKGLCGQLGGGEQYCNVMRL